MENKLTIIVPSFNEGKNLERLLPQLDKFAKLNNFHVILIDDGSTDNSKTIYNSFKSEYFNVFAYKNNRGVGGALKVGIANVKTKYLVTFDADGQHNLSDIIKLFSLIISKDYDLIVGERANDWKSNIYRSIGKNIIRVFARVLTKSKIKDLNSGLRMFRTDIIRKYVECLPDGFSFHDLSTLIFILKKYEIGAISIEVNNREFGKSIVSTKHALITINDIINIIVLFHPFRIFLPVAIVFFLSGIIWAIPYLLAGRGLSVGALLLILMGVFSFFFGIISEQLSQIRKSQLKLYD